MDTASSLRMFSKMVKAAAGPKKRQKTEDKGASGFEELAEAQLASATACLIATAQKLGIYRPTEDAAKAQLGLLTKAADLAVQMRSGAGRVFKGLLKPF